MTTRDTEKTRPSEKKDVAISKIQEKSILAKARERLVEGPFAKTILLVILVAGIASFLLLPKEKSIVKDFVLGKIARSDVKAMRDLVIVDEETTERKRTEAEASVKNVYDFSLDIRTNVLKKVADAFSLIREDVVHEQEELAIDKKARMGKARETKRLTFRRRKELKAAIKKTYLEKKSFFQDTLGIELTDNQYASLIKDNFNYEIANAINYLLGLIMQDMIIIDRELLDKDKKQGITVHYQFKENKKTKLLDNLDAIIDLKLARKKVSDWANSHSFFPKLSKESKAVVVLISQKIIKPNFSFNQASTLSEKMKVKESVKKSTVNIQKGEIIIRKGDKVTDSHLVILNGIERQERGATRYTLFFGFVCFFILIIILIHTVFRKFVPGYRIRFKDLIFLGLLLIFTILLVQLSTFLSKSIYDNFPIIPLDAYKFGIPFFAAVLLVGLVLSSEIAIAFTFLLAITMGLTADFNDILSENSFLYACYAFVGCLIAVYKTTQANQRLTVIKGGVFIGLFNIIAIVVFSFIENKIIFLAPASDAAYTLLVGFLGGLFSSIIVLGVAPIIEAVGYTTNIKLLELANTDHPLLAKLAIQAPGTNHHSFVVGRLAEAASESIGANSLLAKVACLYHDIGKVEKPGYFIENQIGNENKHEKLTPRMSALIIIAHVKDGLELAKKYKLPKVISDIIPQHHGTSLISYFYSKAKQQEKPDMDAVNENDYRYPGSKPKTKEAGIIMLADATEAATRSLTEPNAPRIKGVVTLIINKAFSDGQLDECDLTFKELNIIAESFTKVLTTSIYHHRIDYPSTPGPSISIVKKTTNENSNNKQNQKKNTKPQTFNGSS